jgi:hypothetical protein
VAPGRRPLFILNDDISYLTKKLVVRFEAKGNRATEIEPAISHSVVVRRACIKCQLTDDDV